MKILNEIAKNKYVCTATSIFSSLVYVTGLYNFALKPNLTFGFYEELTLVIGFAMLICLILSGAKIVTVIELVKANEKLDENAETDDEVTKGCPEEFKGNYIESKKLERQFSTLYTIHSSVCNLAITTCAFLLNTDAMAGGAKVYFRYFVILTITYITLQGLWCAFKAIKYKMHLKKVRQVKQDSIDLINKVKAYLREEKQAKDGDNQASVTEDDTNSDTDDNAALKDTKANLEKR